LVTSHCSPLSEPPPSLVKPTGYCDIPGRVSP